MINRKLGGIIAMVAIVAVASGIYGLSEMSPTMMRSGTSQFGDYTFDQRVDRNPLTIVGEISNVQIQTFEETVMGTDCDDCEEYVIEVTKQPKAIVTVNVLEVLKDDGILNGNTTVTFVDGEYTGLGKIDDRTALFQSSYSVDYNVGDKGIFIINEDRGLNMMGFTSYYPIDDARTTVTSGFDQMTEKTPIEITTAKNTAKLVAERTQ